MVSRLSSCARPVVGGLHGVSALAWGIRGAPFFKCDNSRQNGCAGKTWGIRVDMGCPRPGPAYLCRRCVELVHGSRWPRPQAPGVTPNASKHKRRRVGAQIARIPDNEHEHARHEHAKRSAHEHGHEYTAKHARKCSTAVEVPTCAGWPWVQSVGVVLFNCGPPWVKIVKAGLQNMKAGELAKPNDSARRL